MKKVYARVSSSPDYDLISFEEFLNWLPSQTAYQLDIETPTNLELRQLRLRTVQFGTLDGSLQWVIEWELLKDEQKQFILHQLTNPGVKKYIHNAVFEYTVFKNYAVDLENIFDTILAEKILYAGHSTVLDEDGATFFSLEAVARRRLGIDMDKTYQSLFGFDIPLTPGHINYAAQDVSVLGPISHQQLRELEAKESLEVLKLENEAVKAFGDIVWNGMRIDKEAWMRNYAEAGPLVEQAKKDCDAFITDDINEPALYDKAVELGMVYTEDTIEINWNAPKQREELLQLAFPDLPGATKPIIRKYMKSLPEDSAAYTLLFHLTENKDYEFFFELLKTHCRQELIDRGYLKLAGTTNVNWNGKAVIELLQVIKPGIKDMQKETMNKIPHPLATAIQEYRSSLKLLSSYGPKFLKHMDSDGKIRTRFNQILETGRVSSAEPNMQQVPANDRVENKYRNCFIPSTPDMVFVDGDYKSQELVIIAELSKDPVWMDALHHGHDLHSVCAELVYGKEWKEAALDDCKFVKERDKCSCPGHKRMRTGVKTINFGLAYGMSEFKLAATLKIDLKEAKALIDKYFNTFPKIGGKLNSLGRFGIRNGFIMTLNPFFRKRWYPLWNTVNHLIDAHINGIEYNPILGSIERTSKNLPIQGSGADMTKLALVYIRKFIKKHHLEEKIRLSMQVHDQITTECTRDIAEQWRPKMQQLMEQAAKVIIPSGLLKAEVSITEKWTK